jgi:HSP20 family protein
MNLIHYTPSRWFESAVNRMFSDNFDAPAWEIAAAQPSFNPRVDVRDEREAVVLSAEIPGVEKENVTVEVHDGVITLSGTKERKEVSEEEGVYRAERVYGEFKRSFGLPDTVDASRIDAEFRNGVLKVTLPKKPEAAPKQIAIRGENGGSKQIGVK